MNYLHLPLFEDHHRHLAGSEQRLCTMARMLAQDAAEEACSTVALLGGLARNAFWTIPRAP